MEVIFENIHKVVLDTLRPRVKKAVILDIIGCWYYKFLCSDEKELSLKLPYYEPRSLNDIYQYLRIFLLTYKLINKTKLTNFNNACLFNVFGYVLNNSKPKRDDCSMGFIGEKGNLLIWDNGILTPKDVFLPVFNKYQCENGNWNVINNTFKLFKAIRDNGLIEHPILIDLEKDVSLSISCSNELTPEEFLLFETIVYDKNSTDDDEIDLEDTLNEKNLTGQIAITYPYHRNIRSWFLKNTPKRFELNIYDRFCHNDISDADLFLLPRETFLGKTIIDDFNSKVKIINTNHGQGLYDLMHTLKEKWQGYEFNKFTTPFPKYWFLFINKELSKEEWIKQFKINYPRVAQTAIIRDIEKIIIELYELNWTESLIKGIEKPAFLIPNMTGLKAKRLKIAFVSFKNYLLMMNSQVEFVEINDHYKYHEHRDLIILEAFNLIDIVNIIQNNKPDNYMIAIPDFIYFSYQPWIKYHLANYQFDALLSSQRKSLDGNYQINFMVWQELKVKIIKEIKSEINAYQKKYNITVIEDEPKDITPESEDFELKNSEEIEMMEKKREKTFQEEFDIFSSKGYWLRLSSKSEVLIQRNTIVIGRAVDLKQGDYFISIKELNSSFDYEKVIDRLSDVPTSVRGFQIELSEYANVYKILENRGLHYNSEDYFNHKYIISAQRFKDDLFMLPRKRKHWELICEFLNIDNNDISLTWIAYYGRKHINEVKNMYRYILNLFLQKNYFGEAENPALIQEVTNYVHSKENVFDYGEEFDSIEIARSMISSIVNILDFHEVIEIKTSAYE